MDKKLHPICVYIGSFDPFHNGHLECIEKARGVCKNLTQVVILPNNPRKGKPERKSLAFRCHIMGRMFPVYADFSWLAEEGFMRGENSGVAVAMNAWNNEKSRRSNDDQKYLPIGDEKPCVLVDTRNCDYVLTELRKLGYPIYGIIGSDIFYPGLPVASIITSKSSTDTNTNTDTNTDTITNTSSTRAYTNASSVDRSTGVGAAMKSSDTVIPKSYKIPKWHADKWIIIERLGYTLLLDMYKGLNIHAVIPLSQTKFQHLSSTAIKRDRAIHDVPLIMAQYIDKKCDTLSENTLELEFFKEQSPPVVRKTFRSDLHASNYADNLRFVANSSSNGRTPFILSSLVSISGSILEETYIPNMGTIFDFINDPKFPHIIKQFMDMLEIHCTVCNWIHGDLSAKNILVCSVTKDDRDRYTFALIDWDRVTKDPNERQIIRHRNKFLSSLQYYSILSGKNLNDGLHLGIVSKIAHNCNRKVQKRISRDIWNRINGRLSYP